MSTLDKLGKMTVVVADTGDFLAIKKHKPRDTTTNPSLLLAAAQMPEYRKLLERTIRETDISSSQSISPLLEKLAVNFAKEILAIVPGRVSVEVDATLS
ncbi:MAG: transaldolase family protein, partial [Candidatus Marinimicrobia bacterium]|nr:transaldolase family protein [Candidatus Neomarinimicrobiota bacterium]